MLVVEIQYGYGWAYPKNKDEKISNVEMLPVQHFKIRLQKLTILHNHVYCSIVGIIEDETCKYSKSIIEFEIKNEGIYNFDSKVSVCNVFIITPEQFDVKISSQKSVGGFGKIIPCKNK